MLKVSLYKSKTINTIISFLFALVIFFLPYDAIKFLPSFYRPLSLIPLVLLGLILLPMIGQYKLGKKQKYLLLFYIISNAFSFLFTIIYKTNFKFSFDYFVTSSIGVFLYLIIDFVLKKSIPTGDIKKIVFKLLGIAYIIPLIIALIDALSIRLFLPISVSHLIHQIFGGAFDSRICGVTYEPSWLSSHCIFAFAVYTNIFINRYWKRYNSALFMCLSLLILAFTVSMQGYVLFLISISIFWIIYTKKSPSFGKFFAPLLLLVGIIVLLSYIRNINVDVYYLNRFKNFSISHWINNDSSAYLRILNPVMALMMSPRNIFLGTGGGRFALYYEEYVQRFFPWGLKFNNYQNEIVVSILTGQANPKSFYFRLIGETGIVSIFFFLFMKNCISKVKADSGLLFFIIATIVLPIQFDSMCYFLLFFSLAFIGNLKRRNLYVAISSYVKLQQFV